MVPNIALVGELTGNIWAINLDEKMNMISEEKVLWKKMTTPIVNIVVKDWTVAIMTTTEMEIVDFMNDEVLKVIRIEDLGGTKIFQSVGVDEDACNVPESMTFSDDGALFAFSYGANIFIFNTGVGVGIPTVQRQPQDIEIFNVEIEGFLYALPTVSAIIFKLEFSEDNTRVLASGNEMNPQIWNVVYGSFVCGLAERNWDNFTQVDFTNSPRLMNSEEVMFSNATFKNGGKAVQYCIEHSSFPICHVLIVEIDSWKVLRHFKRDSHGGGYFHFSKGGEYGCVLDSSDGCMKVFDFTELGSCDYPVDDDMKGEDVSIRFEHDRLYCHVNHENVTTSLYEDPKEEHPCTCHLNEDCTVMGHKGELTFVTFFPKEEQSAYQLLATGGTDKVIFFWELSNLTAECISSQTFDYTPTSIAFIADPIKDEDRRMAFAMGFQERLGSKSAVSLLSDDVMQRLIFKGRFAK